MISITSTATAALSTEMQKIGEVMQQAAEKAAPEATDTQSAPSEEPEVRDAEVKEDNDKKEGA